MDFQRLKSFLSGQKVEETAQAAAPATPERRGLVVKPVKIASAPSAASDPHVQSLAVRLIKEYGGPLGLDKKGSVDKKIGLV